MELSIEVPVTTSSSFPGSIEETSFQILDKGSPPSRTRSNSSQTPSRQLSTEEAYERRKGSQTTIQISPNRPVFLDIPNQGSDNDNSPRNTAEHRHSLSVEFQPYLHRKRSSTRLDSKDQEDLKPRLSQTKRYWSIQAVKGKVTNSCLWNACKALSIGLFLIILGAGMATIGYYAEEARVKHLESMANTTTKHPLVKRPLPPPAHAADSSITRTTNSSGVNGPTIITRPSSLHGLNKLSYIGPVVMGVGGFVIVAACVMTFEARDSAAKIVPARFRKSLAERTKPEDPAYRHSSAQTKWETTGVYGVNSMHYEREKELNRDAITSAFIKFSRTIQSSLDSNTEYYEFKRFGIKNKLLKCPSAPSLFQESTREDRSKIEGPRILRVSIPDPLPKDRRLSTIAYTRQAISVDNPAIREVYTSIYPTFIGETEDEEMELGASATRVHRTDSDESLALDLHLPSCAVTLSVRDSSRSPSAYNEAEISPRRSYNEPAHQLSPEAIAGPSGINIIHFDPVNCSKIEKEESVTKKQSLYSMGHSKETADSCVGTRDNEPLRERRKSRSGRKVKRSETIDSSSTHQRRKSHSKHHHHIHHLQQHHHHSRSRAGSVHSCQEIKTTQPVRSEISRKHQLARQSKVDTAESNKASKREKL